MARICAVVLFIAGLLVSWWPLMALAPLVAVVYGYWALGLTLAVCTDLIFGMPTGMLHTLVFPFTIGAIFCIAVRSLVVRHLR